MKGMNKFLEMLFFSEMGWNGWSGDRGYVKVLLVDLFWGRRGKEGRGLFLLVSKIFHKI